VHVRPRRGNRTGPDTVKPGAKNEGDALAVLRLVEISLEGELHLSVLVEAAAAGSLNLALRPSPTVTSAATTASELAACLAALARGVALNGEIRRNIRVTVAQRVIENGAASAAGVLPGAYLVLDIEPDLGDTFRTVPATRPVEPGIGLAAARAVVVDAGGSIGLSRAQTGGARFTIYLPARQEGGPASSSSSQARAASRV
jgi:hypothetical protein